MGKDERAELSEVVNSLVVLINQMKDVADGLYKHSFDLDRPLIGINKEVIRTVEKILSLAKDPIPVSEKAHAFSLTADPSVSWVLEYLKAEEDKRKSHTDMAKGRSKYFRMLYEGMQRRSEEKNE